MAVAVRDESEVTRGKVQRHVAQRTLRHRLAGYELGDDGGAGPCFDRLNDRLVARQDQEYPERIESYPRPARQILQHLARARAFLADDPAQTAYVRLAGRELRDLGMRVRNDQEQPIDIDPGAAKQVGFGAALDEAEIGSAVEDLVLHLPGIADADTILTAGCSSWKAASRRGSQELAIVWLAAIAKLPATVCEAFSSTWRAAAIRSSTALASGRNRRPAADSSMARPTRLKSCTPLLSSNALMAAEAADCDIPRNPAARVT